MNSQSLEATLKALFENDAMTSVILVKAFSKGEKVLLSEPASELTPLAPSDLFLVKLLVGPGNPGPADAPSTSPGIGIEIWLPRAEQWNGRVHTIGGLGGYDGGGHASLDRVGWFYAALTAGSEGVVSASTDSGHAATNGAWGMNPDGSYPEQLWVDYSHRAMHEMAVKTKAVATAVYGRAPRYCYYEGASTGGRHGYRLAQQYPDDYDGIVAKLPAINLSELGLAWLYRKLVVERDLAEVGLTEEQMDLVSNAAIRAGDLVGGEHLGYILDNEACRYDPTKDPSVICPSDGGTSASPHCVTLAQAQAINKTWYGITTDGSVPDPTDDNGTGVELTGKRLWYGFPRGTSLYSAYFINESALMRDILRANERTFDHLGADQLALIMRDSSIAGLQFKNATGNGQARWRQLSYEQFADAFKLAAAREDDFADVASNNPDLSAFKERGGKFLSWHGWNDEAIPVQGTMRYYERVVEAMGGLEAVQSFFKLYLVPGGGHMSPHGTANLDANPPAIAPNQFYQLLVDWVEHGIEPGRVEITSPVPGETAISQPIFPYPQKAKYAGGDPRKADSYVGS